MINHRKTIVLLFVPIILFLSASYVSSYETHNTDRKKLLLTGDWTLNEVKSMISEWLGTSYPESSATEKVMGTHPWLTLRAIEVAADTYGIDLSNFKNEIIYGSVEEDFDAVGTSIESDYNHLNLNDDADTTSLRGINVNRAENHFMNSEDDTNGLVDSWVNTTRNVSAIYWAKNAPLNLCTYEKALNTSDVAAKWRYLGHVLHLLQDMTSPAHVRNDAHIANKSSYEQRLLELTPKQLSNILENQNFTKKEIKQTIDDYFQDLSSYTRRAFFSEDTIFKSVLNGVNFGFNTSTREDRDYFYGKDSDGNEVILAYKTLSYRVARMQPINNGTSNEALAALHASVDDELLTENNFNYAGTKAIQYAAGMIKLFYDATYTTTPLVVDINSPSGNATITLGQSVNFQGSVTGGSGPYTYQWTINGGSLSSSTVQSPGNVTFNTPGTYTVSFLVSDSSNQTSGASVTIRVSAPTLIASITSPSGSITINPGQSVNFQGTASGGSGSYTYLWIFGGSGIPNSNSQNTGAIVFNSTGSYTINFTVTDSLGTQASRSVFVNVRAVQSLVVGITSPASNTTITVGQSVNFQGTVTGGLAPYTYLWTFGGAASNSLVQNPGNITFTRAGTYTVNFQVSDTYSHVSAASVVITVRYPPLVASIASPSGNRTIAQSQSVTFQGSVSGGSGSYTSFLWNFGGGATNRTVQNPGAVVFNTLGIYTVTFSVTDSAGTSSTSSSVMITVGDTVAPTIVLTSPSNGAIGVATSSVISATFSESIDPTTVTAANFIVTIGTGGDPVPGTAEYSSLTMTFRPSSPLNSETNYSARLTTGIRDLAGNALASNYSWSFTTLQSVLTWNKTLGDIEADYAMSVQQTVDGGYIIVGYTWSYGVGNSDIWLIKTDENGNMVWDKTFGGTAHDWAYSVQQTVDGGYILVGYTESYGAGAEDFWLIKTDENGNIIWNKTFGGTNGELAFCVQQTSDGGYIVTGSTWSYGAGNQDVWLIKTDTNGNMVWNQTFGGTGTDWANSVQQTNDGGYIVAGFSSSYGGAWLIKTNANGNMVWNRTFGISGVGWAASVQQTRDGGYIIGGGGNETWIMKTDANGNIVWNQVFGGTNNETAYSIQQTSDGGYILAGTTSSFGAGAEDVWLIRTDTNGNMIWNQTFGGTGYDGAMSVQQASDGGYIIAGYTLSFGAGSYDAWLIKTDTNGNAPTTP